VCVMSGPIPTRTGEITAKHANGTSLIGTLPNLAPASVFEENVVASEHREFPRLVNVSRLGITDAQTDPWDPHQVANDFYGHPIATSCGELEENL